MTQDPAGTHANGSLNGRLDGWKEIAAYLGRGVRTAQRWERDLGLPVRRLDTGGAEVVYAFRTELDAWLLSQSRGGTSEPPEATADSDGAAARTGRWPWLLAAALVLAAAGIGAWALLPSATPAQPANAEAREPAALEVVGNRLNVRNLDRELLWSRPFDGPLDDFDPSTAGGQANLRRMAAIGDFRGTGRNDVILARNAERDPRLYWFDHAGNLVRTHRIDARIAFGLQRCSSIRFSRLFTNVDPSDTRAIWIAGHELAGNFPAVLQALDTSGQVRSEYWSAGFIGAMAVVHVNGRRWVLVGGVANETGGAALAVFDGSAQGSSPAADPAFRCAGCPAGRPQHYFVFPRSRLQAALAHRAQVVQLIPTSDGLVRVRVCVASVDGGPFGTGSAYYTFDAGFRLVKAELNDDVGPVQRAYESRGLVTSATRFRGAADLWPVLRWNVAGYDRLSGIEQPAGVSAGSADDRR
jgi:hypothetical protein